MQKLTFVIGANAAGKTYFIEHHLANEKAVALNIYDYQQKDTLFWKVHTELPLPIVINEQLTPEEKIIWQRIKAEPESLLEK